MPGFMEVVETETWKMVYEEGWRMWRSGLDRLRKSENGLEAAKAKQLMDDAEHILRLPIFKITVRQDELGDRDRYKKGLQAREEKGIRDEFETSIKGKDDAAR
jgi:hypothetical protein